MELNKQNVLMFEKTMNLGGSSKVVLQLCKILKPYVNKIIVCSTGGINTKTLDQMGIKHYYIGNISDFNPFNVMKILSQLLEVIRKEKITIVHTHHRMATLYMKILDGVCNVKVISTLHGVFDDKQTITRYAYKDIDIIACGNIVKEKFVSNYGIDPSKITVIHNAIEEYSTDIIPIDELSKYKDKTIVAYIGRLSPEKGIDVLIKAIADVISKNSKVLFAFVGDGFDDYKRYIFKLISDLGVKENTLFLGYRNDVQNVIKQVDFIVLPSYTEGLPLTPIEAFSQGKTVVATKAGGTVEIVSHGFNGLLSEVGDYQQLSNNILTLCNNHQLSSNLARNALATYKKYYSFDKFCKETINYYMRLN